MRAVSPSMTAAPWDALPRRRLGLRTGAQLSLVAGAAALYLLVLVGAPAHQDLDTYLRAGSDLRQGRPLYAPFLQHAFPDPTLRPAYIYPPVFALVMVPLTFLPASAAVWVWLALAQLALGITVFFVLRATNPSSWTATAALILTLTFFPLWVDAVQGQANLFILLLVVVGMLGVSAGRVRAASLVGLAAALKLTPALLLGWLLWERRLRAALWLVAGFAAATAAGMVVRAGDTLTFFTRVVPALSQGTAYYGNQSLNGVLARLFAVNPYTEPWLGLPHEDSLWMLAAIVLVVAWIRLSGRITDPLSRALAYLPLLPLLSAITWEHHLVLLLPLLWLCLCRLSARGWPPAPTATLAVIVLLLNAVPRWHPGPAFGSAGFRLAQTHDPLVLLFANGLFLGALVLFAVGPWLLRPAAPVRGPRLAIRKPRPAPVALLP